MLSVTKQEDFRRIYRRGKSYARDMLVLYVLPNDLPICRLGISVSKKNCNSVTRHRFARLVREAVRQAHGQMATGYDLLVVMKRGYSYARPAQLSLQTVSAPLYFLLQRAHIII